MKRSSQPQGVRSLVLNPPLALIRQGQVEVVYKICEDESHLVIR